MKILVVDDQELVLEVFSLTLAREGHEVVTAPDGFEAAKLLDSFAPEVVVTDNDMPGMSGLELAMLAKKRTPPPHIILVTGRPDPGVINDAVRIGVNRCLTKPVGRN